MEKGSHKRMYHTAPWISILQACFPNISGPIKESTVDHVQRTLGLILLHGHTSTACTKGGTRHLDQSEQEGRDGDSVLRGGSLCRRNTSTLTNSCKWVNGKWSLKYYDKEENCITLSLKTHSERKFFNLGTLYIPDILYTKHFFKNIINV